MYSVASLLGPVPVVTQPNMIALDKDMRPAYASCQVTKVRRIVESQGTALSPEQLTAFCRKLETFAAGLSDNERTFLHQMIDDAADAANEDASGYAELAGVLGQEEDEVSGYAMDVFGTGALSGSVIRYGTGVERDETIGDLATIGGHPLE